MAGATLPGIDISCALSRGGGVMVSSEHSRGLTKVKLIKLSRSADELKIAAAYSDEIAALFCGPE